MDKVLAICDNFAILAKGNNPLPDAMKELKSLTDIKFFSDANYLEQQVKPHLQLYGRRLAMDARFHPLHMHERGLPNEQLKEIGYYVYENKHTGTFFLNRTDKTDNNTYAVPIRGMGANAAGVDAGGYALSDLQDAMIYAAKLALLSKDGINNELSITIGNNSEETVVSFADVPLQLWISDWMPLENVFDRMDVDAIVSNYGHITRLNNSLSVHISCITGEKNPNPLRFAASLLLVCLMRTYRFGRGRYVVSSETGAIIEQSSSNLLEAVVQCVAAGKVSACPYCKRPIFGNSQLCRVGGCRQRFNERAQNDIRNGTPIADIKSRYVPYIKESTIENWFAGEKGR